MLRIRNANIADEPGEKMQALDVLDEDWYVTHTYDGNDVLTFQVGSDGTNRLYITEEGTVETKDNRYVIKNVDEHGDLIVVDAVVDTDAWKAIFWHEYRRENTSLDTVLNEIKPNDWTVQTINSFPVTRTVEASEGEPIINATSYDLLGYLSDIFGCVFNFDAKQKIIKVINPADRGDTGDFYLEDINLSAIGYVGDTVDFATRLYAYGAMDDDTGERVDLTSVTGGKGYIEDKSYYDKVVSVGWIDETCTTPSDLLTAAQAKLKELAAPVRSYELSVLELGPGTAMYKTCTLITRSGRQKHQIVEYREYPLRHDLDTITIAAVTPDVSRIVRKAAKEAEKAVTVDNFQKVLDTSNKTAGGSGNKYGSVTIKDSNNNDYVRLDKDTTSFGTSDSPADVEVTGSLKVNGQEVTGGGSGGGGGLPAGDASCNIDVADDETDSIERHLVQIKNDEKSFSYIEAQVQKAKSGNVESYQVSIGKPFDTSTEAPEVDLDLHVNVGNEGKDFRALMRQYGTASFTGPNYEDGYSQMIYHQIRRHGITAMEAMAGKRTNGAYNIYASTTRVGAGAVEVTTSATVQGEDTPNDSDQLVTVRIGKEEAASSQTMMYGTVRVVDALLLRGGDGNTYYRITVDGNGNLQATEVTDAN